MCDQIGIQPSSFRLLIQLGVKLAPLIERIGKGVLMEGSQKVAGLLPDQPLISRGPS